jgi:predicted transcriptional regulator
VRRESDLTEELMADPQNETASLVELTANIASAYVGNNKVALTDLPDLVRCIFGALAAVDTPLQKQTEPLSPAVPIKKSITDTYLICLEDGLKFKSMKRHLGTMHGLSPDDYRAKWRLPRSYPMIAPAYAAARSTMAKQIGLGRRGSGAAKAPPAAKATPKPRK